MPTVPLTRSHPAPLAIGLAGLAAAAALAVLAGLLPTPDLAGTLEDASRTLGVWAYPAVAGLAFLETGAFVGLVVPGETAVLVGGVVAANGDVALVPMIALVWLAAALGDLVSFLLGRRLGRGFLERHGPRLHVGPARLARVERFYERHGGSAVLLGRFVGLLRAVSPFVAGAAGLSLRRFVPWSVAGTLAWAATFTLVGYGFSESFADSGQTAAHIALGAALLAALAYATAVALRARSGRAGGGVAADDPQRDEAAQRAEPGADERAGDDVEREMHAQIYAREAHRGSEHERRRTEPRAEDRNGGRGGEGGGAVPRRERRIARNRGQRAEAGVGHRRPRPPEGLLHHVGDERGGANRGGSGGEGHGQTAAPQVRAEAHAHEQRSLDPPRGQHNEHGGQPWMLEGLSGFDERTVEVEQGRHRLDETESSSAVTRLLLVVNGRASGIEDPRRTADELLAVLEELGADAESAVTRSEEELWEILAFAAESRRRVVLVGGDGTLHAAANAPLATLPELALVPAGRANNIARALGIPVDRAGALAVAASAAAIPVDALRVATPDRFIYALEAVSAGFQAEARADYRAENSADLRQGLRALARAIRRYRPYGASVRVDGEALRWGSAAQLFFSNLPFFGFGFQVAPGADHADGRLDAVVLEARGRTRLLRLLAAARSGRHIGRRGVTRMSATRVKLIEPLPLVADAVPLGTTTATVTVEPARLRVAAMGVPA